MSQRGGCSGRVPVVTKLTGPRWGSSSSSSSSSRGQDGEVPGINEKTEAHTSSSYSPVTAEKPQHQNSNDSESDCQEEWELVKNPGHEADNENDNTRVAQGPGWSCKVDVGFGKGDRRLSLLSWERRVGSLVQKQSPES
ncbi:hypothetical protein PG990_001363 [Apiospora arundinis]|uniref:Uncharacterized protein n=1 Tax=Apiospora arundinis TaxID=335852 RepID=A0ABR2I1X3_9PEZI